MTNNLHDLMKQAQKLQADMEAAQRELESLEIIGEAGGGLIRVACNGRYDVKWVKIDPSALDEDKEIIEDLIAAAMNDAVRKVEKTSRGKMANLASNIGIPGDLPFGDKGNKEE